MRLTPEDVRALVGRGEGREVEFKRGLPAPARLARTLCAFANTRGGILLVGVTDAREIRGVARPREVVARIRRTAREQVEPPLAAAFVTVPVAQARVVACSVPRSPARPHAVLRTDGTREVVVRVGSSNRRATGATLRALARPRRPAAPSELERAVLDFVARHPGTTVPAFAHAHNVGLQRARRAFLALERSGRLVAHGQGRQRAYARA